MKAVIHERYGPPEVLRPGQMPDPEPGPGEVRVAVHASTVTSGDARIRRADPPLVRLFFGLSRPRRRVPGFEFAGVVDRVADGVSAFSEGDRVFGVTGFRFGALAEYLVMPESGTLAKLPDGWSFEDAAAIPFGAATARFFLMDKGGLRRDHRVLVHGASGAVGVAAVQIAKLQGAKVDGVCGPNNLELVRSLGAERVFDYTKESPPEGTYDLVFDAAGKLKAPEGRRWMKAGGRFVSVQKGFAKDRPEDYPILRRWMEQGHLRPVIDSVYPLERIVEAHRRVDTGHKRGAVVVRVRS